MHRAVHASVSVRLVVAAVAASFVAALAPSPAGAAPCWRPPVEAPVADPFRPPACTWCAGNRGIEYRVAPGATIRAAATGEVTFSGAVAGVRYLVVRSADGHRQTYGRLDASHFDIGDRVVAGTPVGTAGGLSSGGSASGASSSGDPAAGRSAAGDRDGTFHFGVRLGDTYVDPAPLLGRLVAPRRLVPTTADRPRPAPAVARCGTSLPDSRRAPIASPRSIRPDRPLSAATSH